MNLPIQSLKQILVASGYVTEKDFDEAAESSKDLGKKVENVLVFRGLISEENFGKLVAEYLKVPYVSAGNLIISEEVLGLIPEKIARFYHIVPFDKEGERLKLAMEDPVDFEALEFARRQTGLAIIPYYATSANIVRALGQYKKNIRAYFDKVIQENIRKASPDEDLVKAAEELPIIKILDTLLEYAVAERASDIHIETQSKEVVVRFRIDGILQDVIKFHRGIEAAVVARIKILSNLKIDEHRIPQDGRYKFSIDRNIIGLRVSIIPGFYGENIVMRILQETSRPLSLEELGVSGHNLALINNNLTRPHGMILVTGPTGSGKTTTLYSILNILNTIKVKICTIEDPIEYGINRVSQIQVNPKSGLTFAAGLRSLLRHDPDIIMVGEIRDEETADIGVHAALTGHLVLSTLHTNNAIGTVSRLLDMGVERYLVSSTVNLIIAQRLVRKICPACIEEYKPDKAIIDLLINELKVNMPRQKFYKGKGCKECSKKGFLGRIGIYEALSITEEVKSLINKKTAASEILKTAIQQGMTTMLEDGINKVSSGLTTIKEVLHAVREK